jgi:hypothetical protein
MHFGMSVSQHKNANNEYFVHAEPIPNVVKTDAWWSRRSKESEEESNPLEAESNPLEAESKPLEAESTVEKLKAEVRKLKEENDNLKETSVYKKMERVEYELKCLKVHNYFLEMHLPAEQKIQMHLKKNNTRETLEKCLDDATYRSMNQNSLRLETNELNLLMQKPHDDDDDKAIVTLTQFIKHRQYWL